MNREELIAIFDNEKTQQETMFRDDPESLIDVWSTEKLLEVTVDMTYGIKVTVFFGTRTEFIDISSDNYIGLGSTLVGPIREIKDIEVRWR